MKRQEIGIADISYRQDSTVESAHFSPTIKIELNETELTDGLFGLKNKTAEEVKNTSELVMASWFNKMNEIELADRNTHEIKGEIMYCEEYTDKKVKRCMIKFFFIERE